MNEQVRILRILEDVKMILAPLTVYTVLELLGEGGAGYVVLVQHRVFGVRAMKLIHDHYLRSKELRQRFDAEARVMNSINHPNVVKVHDLGELGGCPYIVMDYLQGGTLFQHVAEFGAMPPRQAVCVIMAVLRGLQAAHDKGVVHRDIKPDNILFDRVGVPKVNDFGIAHVQEGTRSLTRDGQTMGTLAYMPPEQLAGQVDLIDARADIHAVGVTLYYILTRGDLGHQAFYLQLERDPDRLVGIPEALRRVIRIATAEQREDRFATASAMADELQCILASDELAQDPEDTPVLGSAPLHNADQNPAVEAADAGVEAQPPHMARLGATLVPSPALLVGPDAGPADLNQISTSEGSGKILARRTLHPFLRWVILPGTVVILATSSVLFGLGAWFSTRPEPMAVIPDDIPPAENVSTVPAPARPTLLPVASGVPLPNIPPTAVVESTPVLTAKSTPPTTVVVTPEIVTPTEVKIVEQAQVRLILKPDTAASVTLTGDGGLFTLSGGSREVPQGIYRVSIDMPGREAPQIGTLNVTPGLTVITCDSRFKMCTGFR